MVYRPYPSNATLNPFNEKSKLNHPSLFHRKNKDTHTLEQRLASLAVKASRVHKKARAAAKINEPRGGRIPLQERRKELLEGQDLLWRERGIAVIPKRDGVSFCISARERSMHRVYGGRKCAYIYLYALVLYGPLLGREMLSAEKERQ